MKEKGKKKERKRKERERKKEAVFLIAEEKNGKRKDEGKEERVSVFRVSFLKKWKSLRYGCCRNVHQHLPGKLSLRELHTSTM